MYRKGKIDKTDYSNNPNCYLVFYQQECCGCCYCAIDYKEEMDSYSCVRVNDSKTLYHLDDGCVSDWLVPLFWSNLAYKWAWEKDDDEFEDWEAEATMVWNSRQDQYRYWYHEEKELLGRTNTDAATSSKLYRSLAARTEEQTKDVTGHDYIFED